MSLSSSGELLSDGLLAKVFTGLLEAGVFMIFYQFKLTAEQSEIGPYCSCQ